MKTSTHIAILASFLLACETANGPLFDDGGAGGASSSETSTKPVTVSTTGPTVTSADATVGSSSGSGEPVCECPDGVCVDAWCPSNNGVSLIMKYTTQQTSFYTYAFPFTVEAETTMTAVIVGWGGKEMNGARVDIYDSAPDTTHPPYIGVGPNTSIAYGHWGVSFDGFPDINTAIEANEAKGLLVAPVVLEPGQTYWYTLRAGSQIQPSPFDSSSYYLNEPTCKMGIGPVTVRSFSGIYPEDGPEEDGPEHWGLHQYDHVFPYRIIGSCTPAR